MNLKRINLLKVIIIFLLITLNFQHFAKSQNLTSSQSSSKQLQSFSQFQKEEKQKLIKNK